MQIPALSPAIPPTAPEPSADERKVADSCRQFEAVLWRQMLEKAMSPMLSKPAEGGDQTGTYSYFISDSLAQSISGGPQSFSTLLQAQLTGHSKPTAQH